MAVFVLVLLTGMGTALLFLSRNESKMGQASLRLKKAFYLAESGIEDARVTLFQVNTDDDFNNELIDAAGDNGTFDLDPAALAVVYAPDGTVTGLQGSGDDAPLRPLTELTTPDGTGWYATFLTNDAIDAANPLTDSNGRVVLTAVGAGRDRSTEVVQAILRPYIPLPPVPAAALTLLGPDPSFDNGTSNAQTHTGNDCGEAGGSFAPIVGTVGGPAADGVRGDMHRPEKFSAGPAPEWAGPDTIGDLTDDSGGIVGDAGNGTIDPIWTDCAALADLMENLAFNADYYCDSDLAACEIPGWAANSIVFIDGDLAGTPAGTYTGILAITGTLTYNGNTGWDGAILAIGEGSIDRSGGGGGTPSGGVVVANIDPTPDGVNADKSDWCTTPPDGFGQAVYDASGGGNSTVEWCTNSLDIANSIRKYRVVEFLQH